MRQILDNLMITLKNLHPDCEFGIFNSDSETAFLDVKLNSTISERDLLASIVKYKPTRTIDVDYVQDKLSLAQLLQRIEADGQNLRLKFLNDYLMFGELYFEKEEELRFIQDFFKYRRLSADFENSWWVSYPLEDIQYYLSEFVKLNYQLSNEIPNEDNLNEKGFLKAGWTNNSQKNGKQREAMFTMLMIKLNGLIKTLQEDTSNNTRLESIKNSISITSYQRNKRNGTKPISNIFELIEHFRDASVHKEKSASNISKSVASNSSKTFCSVISADDVLVSFGDGELSIEHHVKPLLKQLILNFKDFETDIFSIVEKETNKVLLWDFCTQFGISHFPSNLFDYNIQIAYNQENNIYRISLKMIILSYEEVLKRYQTN